MSRRYKPVAHAGSFTTSGGDFRELMNDILDEYGTEVIDTVEKVARDLSQEALQDVQQSSLQSVGGSGKYAKGWRTKYDISALSIVATVWNATEWQLTHLLEYGHQVIRGGRDVGDASAHPHINEVKEWAFDQFEKRLIREIEGL